MTPFLLPSSFRWNCLFANTDKKTLTGGISNSWSSSSSRPVSDNDPHSFLCSSVLPLPPPPNMSDCILSPQTPISLPTLYSQIVTLTPISLRKKRETKDLCTRLHHTCPSLPSILRLNWLSVTRDGKLWALSKSQIIMEIRILFSHFSLTH